MSLDVEEEPAALAATIRSGGDLEAVWRSGLATSGEIADRAARHHRLPHLALADLDGAVASVGELSRRYLREGHLCPLALEDGSDVLLVADPARADVIAAVGLAIGRALPLAVGSFEDIDVLLERVGPAPEAASEPAGDAAVTLEESVDTLQDLARGAPIVRLIDHLLERAIDLGATDIHLETERDQLRVRLRVDGLLRIEPPVARHLAPAVLSRIKILAGLDIAERRLPQDGRADVRVGPVEADLRVAIMPTMFGETAVLRILVKDLRLLEFGRIGIGEADRSALTALLAEPHGIVIVTGPTGSGKTTTLATAISLLNDPSRKIVTVEDPVEYQIAGVHQTQVRPAIGITFASALRSFLRHDPDIIMVGEMRDRETAGIGIQAALTGHLVLTTLHTNSASDALVRLIDMGVEPYLIGSALRGVLGQRLVRRLCQRCRRPAGADDTAALRAFAKTRDVPLAPDASAFVATGCGACGGTGYRGRVGIFEVLRVDDAIRALVREEPDPRAVADAARRNGMTTMMEDGLVKVAAGITTLGEVLRATG